MMPSVDIQPNRGLVEPSLRYHPERFSLTRPYAIYAASCIGNSKTDGKPMIEGQRRLLGLIAENYKNIVNLYGQNIHLSFEQLIENELYCLAQYAAFVTGGRNIYHFVPKLINIFKRIDPPKISVPLSEFPHKAFYMSLGYTEGMVLEDAGCYIEGAYINVYTNDTVLITLTSSKIWTQGKGKTSQRLSATTDLCFRYKVQAVDGLIRPEDLIDGGHDEIMTKYYNGIRDKRYYATSCAIMEALTLMTHGLYCIAVYDKNFKERLVKSKTCVMVGKHTRITMPQGYNIIKYCGNPVNNSTYDTITDEQAKTLPDRTGYWRETAYGTARKERKIDLIMPIYK
jgi:hypothetical protein